MAAVSSLMFWVLDVFSTHADSSSEHCNIVEQQNYITEVGAMYSEHLQNKQKE